LKEEEELKSGEKPKVYVIAGPNGAGKTTFAQTFLPQFAECEEFINADLIAAGIAPFAPEKAAIRAGKLVLERIEELSNKKMNFAFESTLAGQSNAVLLSRLKTKGYHVTIYYLWVPTPEIAAKRVKTRVEHGGHDIPVEDIYRRFTRSISNLFKLYIPISNLASIFDNSGRDPLLIAEYQENKWKYEDQEKYRVIKERIKEK
jgi:predicted ABC-type ATPase